MYLILVREGDAWAQMGEDDTLEGALSAAPEGAQIELQTGTSSEIIRHGT